MVLFYALTPVSYVSWDIRPFFAGQDRCVKLFRGMFSWQTFAWSRSVSLTWVCLSLAGHRHTMEKMLLRCAWSPDGKRVTGGSGDSFVYIWDVATTKLEYKLPGHKGSVNEVGRMRCVFMMCV